MDLKDSRRLPAFPTGIDTDQAGMTLRDYFAAMALQGWLASYGQPDRHPADSSRGVEAVEECALVARMSYELADAMLKARAK